MFKSVTLAALASAQSFEDRLTELREARLQSLKPVYPDEKPAEETTPEPEVAEEETTPEPQPKDEEFDLPVDFPEIPKWSNYQEISMLSGCMAFADTWQVYNLAKIE